MRVSHSPGIGISVLRHRGWSECRGTGKVSIEQSLKRNQNQAERAMNEAGYLK